MRPFDLPLGYKYATAYAGIRKQEKDDLALIVSAVPAVAPAAVFTQNKVQAAPVKLARANMRLSKGVCGAILVNSGNANCATNVGVDAGLERVALAVHLQLIPKRREALRETECAGTRRPRRSYPRDLRLHLRIRPRRGATDSGCRSHRSRDRGAL